jgi:hypothetical protein
LATFFGKKGEVVFEGRYKARLIMARYLLIWMATPRCPPVTASSHIYQFPLLSLCTNHYARSGCRFLLLSDWHVSAEMLDQ